LRLEYGEQIEAQCDPAREEEPRGGWLSTSTGSVHERVPQRHRRRLPGPSLVLVDSAQCLADSRIQFTFEQVLDPAFPSLQKFPTTRHKILSSGF